MKIKFAAAAAALAVMTAPAYAGDWSVFTFEDFMANPDVQAELGDFPIQFGENPSGSSLGRSTSNRPTSAWHKDTQYACERALLNSLMAMRDQTLSRGGSRLTGVHSENGLVKNPSKEYACSHNHFRANSPIVGTMTK